MWIWKKKHQIIKFFQPQHFDQSKTGYYYLFGACWNQSSGAFCLIQRVGNKVAKLDFHLSPTPSMIADLKETYVIWHAQYTYYVVHCLCYGWLEWLIQRLKCIERSIDYLTKS